MLGKKLGKPSAIENPNNAQVKYELTINIRCEECNDRNLNISS